VVGLELSLLIDKINKLFYEKKYHSPSLLLLEQFFAYGTKQSDV